MEKSGKEMLKERFEVLKYNWDLIEQMARELYSEFGDKNTSEFDDLTIEHQEYWYRTTKSMLAKLHVFKR